MQSKLRPKLPPWIRVRIGSGPEKEKVAGILDGLSLNTVCSGAKCPNLNECWNRGTATFMILGRTCTRNCRFCAVRKTPAPEAPDSSEPSRVAEAAARMNLKYVVVTSVTRDDLPDGGAGHFSRTVREIRGRLPEAGIEVLTPDFKGDAGALAEILGALPTVFNHNVETVRRLTPAIRSGAEYARSLEVLSFVARKSGGAVAVKSGLMAGMGETDAEIEEAIRDIRAAGAEILTIGQYLPPLKDSWPLDRYVPPDVFNSWREFALSRGFRSVASGPLVRSSYHADEVCAKIA